jgi:hypothetical protein
MAPIPLLGSVRNLLRRRARHKVRECKLAALTPPLLDDIRSDPANIRSAFGRCESEFVATLGAAFSHLTPREREFAFSTVVAHHLAPWGSDSTCVTFPAMVRERTLNCGNYGLLAHHLARVLLGDRQESVRLRVVGWDGPGIGNHQMLFLDRPERSGSLLLDPTIGLVGNSDFDTVACGHPVPRRRLLVFRARGGLEDFEDVVLGALLEGRVRPSDLMYYFDGFDHLLGRYGHPKDWPTPGASNWRDRTSAEARE